MVGMSTQFPAQSREKVEINNLHIEDKKENVKWSDIVSRNLGRNTSHTCKNYNNVNNEMNIDKNYAVDKNDFNLFA